MTQDYGRSDQSGSEYIYSSAYSEQNLSDHTSDYSYYDYYDTDEEIFVSDSPTLSNAEDVDPEEKPFLSKMLNGMGVNTSPGIDWTFDWLQVFIIAGILAWLVMSFVMVRMRVPTGSMIPTIAVGDSFFVDKFSYRLGFNEPEPGDIVVFWHTEQNKKCYEHSFLLWEWGERTADCQERYVKRLIAVGPAEVTIRQGDIYVDGIELNNAAFDRDYVCRNSEHRNPELRSAEGCSFTIHAGEYFVMGDNTRNSSDSRYWGAVMRDEFIGEPFFRVWPKDRIGPMNQYFGSNP